MIMPGKHLQQDRALLGIGGEILAALEEGRTVSELWETVQWHRSSRANPLPFDWFVLALSFLFAIGAVTLERGVLTKVGEP
jgi:hypothetical protein